MTNNAFCPKCGKRGIIGKMCSECTEQDFELEFKDKSILICIECGQVKVRSAWNRFKTIDEGILSAFKVNVRNPLNLNLKIKTCYDELKNKPGAKQDIDMEVSTEGQEFIIPTKLEFTYCGNCRKSGTQYFEGTLQLRDVTPELIDFVRDDISAREGVHINKESGKGCNIDMRISSARYLRALGSKLVKKYNGELKSTSKLFSWNKQTSREIHRVNLLFRLRNYKIGDIVETNGMNVKVTTVGRRVTGIDMETGKKVFVE
ncbi:hypothetical protein HQ545_08645 [Candidatus Woesearchaeota archaeon]|nr:hypothetical protein [Candidatus Woesearchaeota archaeon]